MPKIKGSRHGKKTRHKTVTEEAGRVYQLLLEEKFTPYPGIIAGGTVSHFRITLTYETNRTRITVSKNAVQELLLYGPIDRDKLETVLLGYAGRFLTIRDHAKVLIPNMVVDQSKECSC
jgi:hypothetical protein